MSASSGLTPCGTAGGLMRGDRSSTAASSPGGSRVHEATGGPSLTATGSVNEDRLSSSIGAGIPLSATQGRSSIMLGQALRANRVSNASGVQASPGSSSRRNLLVLPDHQRGIQLTTSSRTDPLTSSQGQRSYASSTRPGTTNASVDDGFFNRTPGRVPAAADAPAVVRNLDCGSNASRSVTMQETIPTAMLSQPMQSAADSAAGPGVTTHPCEVAVATIAEPPTASALGNCCRLFSGDRGSSMRLMWLDDKSAGPPPAQDTKETYSLRQNVSRAAVQPLGKQGNEPSGSSAPTQGPEVTGAAQIRQGVMEQAGDGTDVDSRVELQGIRTEIERLRAETMARRASRGAAMRGFGTGLGSGAPGEVQARPREETSRQSMERETHETQQERQQWQRQQHQLDSPRHQQQLLLPSHQQPVACTDNPRDGLTQAPSATNQSDENGGSSILILAEGLQGQLDEVFLQLKAEQRAKECLGSAMGDLDRRVTEGLHSMGEVASARIATDSATDSMLNALRGCVDELNEQCAWPPPDKAQKSSEESSLTLAHVVQNQWLQLEQLQATQQQLHLRRQDSCNSITDEQLVTLQALPARHDSMAEALDMLQGRVAEVLALQRCNAERGGSEGLPEEARQFWLHQQQQLQAVEMQVEQLRTEPRGPAAETYKSFVEEVQQQLQALQQQIATRESTAVAVPGGELTAGLRNVEGQVLALQGEKSQIVEALQAIQDQQQQMQLQQQQQEKELRAILARRQGDEERASAMQELRAEVTVIARAVNMLSGRVEQLVTHDTTGGLQTDIGTIANVVNKLSERVDRMSPPEEPQSPLKLSTKHLSPQQQWHGPDASGESADGSNALRQQLATLVGEVHRLSSGPGTGLAACVAKAAQPSPSAWRAPSPKRWLDEPLSVSVARSADEQFIPSPTAERILQRAAATSAAR